MASDNVTYQSADTNSGTPPAPLSVIVIDDHPDQGRALGEALQPDFRCLAVVDSAKAALALLHDKQIDLILVDLILRGVSGIDCLRELRRDFVGAIVVYGSMEDERAYLESIHAGAQSYIPRLGRTDWIRKILVDAVQTTPKS